MSKVFEGVKFLFPGTSFIIRWRDKKLWEITKHGKVDWTDHVINWDPFLTIIRYGFEDQEKLVLDLGPDNQTLVFYNAAIGRLLCVCAETVIQNISLKKEEEMKILKKGDYYINILSPSLISTINNEDFTDMIGDFSKFSYLGVDAMGDTIRLIKSPDDEFMFVRYPSTNGRFIMLNEVLNLKEEKEMSEVVNRELTLEERIKQLEKEKAELELQIKNQKKYDEFRKSGDEMALAMKALQDSGFSRDEAMQILMMVGMNSMIPPFLRR